MSQQVDDVSDDDAERALLALAGAPPRMRWSEYLASGYRVRPGALLAGDVGRARGRASARLIAEHRPEFDRYCLEEQWKIVRGETK